LGEWNNNIFNGNGIYIFSSGERFEGCLVNGMKEVNLKNKTFK
jgi:hypothetical protein